MEINAKHLMNKSKSAELVNNECNGGSYNP